MLSGHRVERNRYLFGGKMYSYYTAILILAWYALGILCLLVWENDRMPRTDKRLLYLTYALIAVSSLAEWCGVQLDGNMNYPVQALKTAKCFDYILTPMAGGVLIFQLRPKIRLRKLLIGLLACNTCFQIVSAFHDWMITVDASNTYHHGRLYWLYIALCMVIVTLVVISLAVYGRNFRRQNAKSLFAIIGLIVLGIAMQEILPGSYRTSYLALTMGAAMIFIHYNEFSFLRLDDRVAVQQIQIDTDSLTGLYNRFAYTRTFREYGQDALPEDLAVFMMDINGLKHVNDTMGHDAGDELIIGAADCIRKAFEGSARCYRIGGDEFAALANVSRVQAETIVANLKRETKHWQGSLVTSLSMAIGFALAEDYPEFDIERLGRKADKVMYAAKTEYYRQQGIDRRNSQR